MSQMTIVKNFILNRRTRSQALNRGGFQTSLTSRLRPRASSWQVRSAESIEKIKWQSLQHNGPLFPEPYKRLPQDVHFYYDNEPVELTEQAEEVATYYAKLLNTPYVQHGTFNKNFFNSFQTCLSGEQRRQINRFDLCDFREISRYLMKSRTNAHRKVELNQYRYCLINGQRERVVQYRIPPPGLYCPRDLAQQSSSMIMGKIRPRVLPEDIIINCDQNGDAPTPPPGHRWQQVVHDPSVGYLYSWHNLLSGKTSYVHSRRNISGPYRMPRREQLDTARRLKYQRSQIRREYRHLWSSPQRLERQQGVALYCIDELGMSSYQEDKFIPVLPNLRVKELVLFPRLHGRQYVVKLLTEDIQREFTVKREVFYNLTVFMENKGPDDLVFERLSAKLLHDHMEKLMDGLDPYIFYICNASRILQQRLDGLRCFESLSCLLKNYNLILRDIVRSCPLRNPVNKNWKLNSQSKHDVLYKFIRAIMTETDRLVKATISYLEPRITISWCLRHGIPIEVMYRSSTIRRRLKWAIDCTTEHFRF